MVFCPALVDSLRNRKMPPNDLPRDDDEDQITMNHRQHVFFIFYENYVCFKRNYKYGKYFTKEE